MTTNTTTDPERSLEATTTTTTTEVAILQEEVRRLYAQARAGEEARHLIERFEQMFAPDPTLPDQTADDLNDACKAAWAIVRASFDADTPSAIVESTDKLPVRALAVMLAFIGAVAEMNATNATLCIGCDTAFPGDEIKAHVAECPQHPLGQRIQALEQRYAIRYAEAAEWEARAVALREAGERLAEVVRAAWRSERSEVNEATDALAAWQRAADLRPTNTGGK